MPANSPWKTIQQAFKDIKAQPYTFAFSSGGINSISHLPMETLITEMGLELRHIPFMGAGPALISLDGNQAHCSAQYPGPSLPFIKSGQLRALASFSPDRYKNSEDVPTFKEPVYN